MANIKIQPDELSSGVAKTITLNTKDTYVLEDIDVIVKPHAGSFNNAPTTGVTYTENTETKTILPAGGYLYLNKGWFDDTKISLGHLIPDDADYPNAGDAHILFGYEAYDTDGTKLIGTMATVDPKFDGGGLTVTPSVTSLTAPTVTVSSSGTFKSATAYGVTTTKPTTGTDGTNYLTIDGSAKATNGSVKATATYSRDAVLYNGATTGYIDKADNTVALSAISSTSATSSSKGITPTVTDNFAPLYIPIIKSMSVKGGDMIKGTSSVTLSGDNPTVTIKKSGAFTDVASGGVGTSYGVTTIAPTGTDGTNFLKITIDGSSDTKTFTGSSSIKVSRADVKHDGAAAGAINWTDGSSILAGISNQEFTASTDSNTQKTVTASVTGGTSYYIPIVSLIDKGTGGAVTASASVEYTWKPSKLDYRILGTIIDNGMTNYGVSNTKPTSGDYFSLFIHPDLTESGEVSGTASGTWSRTAVKSNGTYKGAVSLTTDTQFLTSDSGNITGENFKQFVNINWDATVGKRDWYFTKATLGDITGGDLSAGTLSITGTDPYVTPDISFLSRTNSTNGSAITLSTYGITETPPTKGEWVVFDPTGTPTDATYTGSVSVTRSAASVNVTKGLTTGDTKNLEAASETYTNTKTIIPGVKDGTSRYISVVAPTASVFKHTITNPTVNCSEEAKYFINGTEQSSTPSGIIVGQASNPSDFGTASYIKIAPSCSTTNGSSTASASAKMDAGITAGGEDISNDSTQSVGVTNGTSKYCFIKVYDGSYTLS